MHGPPNVIRETVGFLPKFDTLLPNSASHTPSNGKRKSDVNGVRISRSMRPP